jgi:zinc transport system substrate-binding protein
MVGVLVAGAAGRGAAAERLSVFVSVPPQVCFVERVGGERVSVEALIGPGQDPHTFEPTPRQMARVSSAALYVRVGLPFEARLVEHIARLNPRLTVVDQSRDVSRRRLSEAEAEGGGHAHDREPELDPHIWLDPRSAKVQAGTIAAALQAADPAHAAEYAANLQRFREALDAVDRRIAAVLAPFRGRAFYVFHPAFGYFADAYGLRQVAVETGGKEPAARHVAALIAAARRDGVRVIFVQPQFSPKAAETIARSIGGVVVPLDALAPDCLRNLERMAGQIAAALGEAAPPRQKP